MIILTSGLLSMSSLNKLISKKGTSDLQDHVVPLPINKFI